MEPSTEQARENCTTRAGLVEVMRNACNLLPDLLAIAAEYVVWDLRNLQVGDVVEAMDVHGKWYVAVVTSIGPDGVRVHYLGWTCRYDELISTQGRLREPRVRLWHAWKSIGDAFMFDSCITKLIAITTLDEDKCFHLKFPSPDQITMRASFSCKANCSADRPCNQQHYFSDIAVDMSTLRCSFLETAALDLSVQQQMEPSSEQARENRNKRAALVEVMGNACNLLPDLLAIAAEYLVWDLRNLQVGDIVEAMDVHGGWYVAVVMTIEPELRVHYIGWNCYYDELISRHGRLREARELCGFWHQWKSIGDAFLFDSCIAKIMAITTHDEETCFHLKFPSADQVTVMASFSCTANCSVDRPCKKKHYFSHLAVDMNTIRCSSFNKSDL